MIICPVAVCLALVCESALRGKAKCHFQICPALATNVSVYSVLGFRSCVLSHDTERNVKDKTKILHFPPSIE